MNRHLAQNSIIIPQQYGFREKHSCIQQLLRVTEFAIIEHNKNRITQLALLDLKKAFDSLWHDALILKLKRIQMSEGIIKLIYSYLTHRHIYVTVNGANLSIRRIKAGVPQGSILRPIFFNIYINDIPISTNTHLAIYTDDTAIYTSSWNPVQATKYLQAHIDQILKFFQNWKLTVNAQKTQAITFSRKVSPLTTQIKIQGHPIQWEPKVKYLGVVLDHKITWAPAIHARISLTYPLLKRIYSLIAPNSKLKSSIKITLYKTSIKNTAGRTTRKTNKKKKKKRNTAR